MVTAGADPESFPSTAPFDFNSATYFIPMTEKIGMAIAGLLMGNLSDRFGRRPLLLLMTIGGVVGSIGKWFARSSFFAFCGVNFAYGFLVSSTEALELR